jgi:hypothetical protein
MVCDRPWSVKTRIAGPSGHLSNEAAATLIGQMRPPRLQTLLLAHISETCNTPYLAETTMRKALLACGLAHVTLACLSPDTVSGVYEVRDGVVTGALIGQAVSKLFLVDTRSKQIY